MKGDRAATALVNDLDLEPEKVTQLPFEHFEVGVDRLGGIARAGARRSGRGFMPSPRSFAKSTTRPRPSLR